MSRGKQAAETFEVLMHLMVLTFMLGVAYHAQLDPQEIWRKYRLRRVPLRQWADPYWMSLYEAEAPGAEAG